MLTLSLRYEPTLKQQLAYKPMCKFFYKGHCIVAFGIRSHYRSGTVNSKSFVGKVLLRIKRKFELTYVL